MLFEDTDLALIPGPGAMTLRQQLAHLVAASDFTTDLLLLPVPTRDGFQRLPVLDTVREACVQLAQALRRVQQGTACVSEDAWNEVSTVLGPAWARPRRQLAFLMLEHAVHHTGALHVYARMAGKIPPKIYDPVDESLLAGLE
jgi:uncharacterized damage-inducible protein DinB